MNPNLILFILILSSAVGWMSTDLYAPSLAHLPAYFGTDAATVKLTMSLNALAYASATLVHGPLCERFGRRPVLLGGIAFLTISSLLCGLSANIGQLITARVLQGVAAAAEGVVVLAIIRDIFSGRDQVRALAVYGASTALVPAAAPILGGYIYIWFGWRMNFYLLALLGFMVTLAIAFLLRESGSRDLHALAPREILRDYLGLLGNRQFICITLIGGGTLGFFFAFLTAGPFILIHGHGLPTEYFGYFQGMVVIAYIAGSVVASRLTRRYSGGVLMRAGALVSVAGAAILLVIVFGGLETPLTLAVALVLMAFGDGPVYATTPSLAMDVAKSRIGSAAAMLIAIEIGVCSLAALAVGVFHDGTSRPMALTCAFLSLVVVPCLYFQKRYASEGTEH